MRVIFMGSPDFAVPSLTALASVHDVVAVYTQPDRVRGRGRTLLPTAVKLESERLGIEVRTPQTLRDPAVQRAFAETGADIACVAAYGLILPAEVLESTRFGCVNVHASLLPRHRGAAPVQRAILAGDEVTGVSIMRMDVGLDTGPYAEVRAVPVDDHDATTLTALLADVGAEALISTLDAIASGSVVWTPQDEASATYAAKITDADVALHPALAVGEAARRVRASGPSARSKIRLCSVRLDVMSVSLSETSVEPGMALLGKDGVVLGFADGALSADEVRPEGRASMSGEAFACGRRVDPRMPWEPE